MRAFTFGNVVGNMPQLLAMGLAGDALPPKLACKGYLCTELAGLQNGLINKIYLYQHVAVGMKDEEELCMYSGGSCCPPQTQFYRIPHTGCPQEK